MRVSAHTYIHTYRGAKQPDRERKRDRGREGGRALPPVAPLRDPQACVHRHVSVGWVGCGGKEGEKRVRARAM